MPSEVLITPSQRPLRIDPLWGSSWKAMFDGFFQKV